jgi:nuclear pore complex protein Nup98-Nup96
MIRLPELQASLDDASAVPDATQASELEDLVRSIPKLIDMLPNVLRNREDPRHNAALADMIAELILKLDKVKPLALVRGDLLFFSQQLIMPGFAVAITSEAGTSR